MSAFDRTGMVKAIPFDVSVVLTGSAVVLVPKTGNLNRCIEIQNLGTGAIGITFTSTNPQIGTKGTISIPGGGGTWRSFEGFVPYADIWVTGPAGTNVTCWYY